MFEEFEGEKTNAREARRYVCCASAHRAPHKNGRWSSTAGEHRNPAGRSVSAGRAMLMMVPSSATINWARAIKANPGAAHSVGQWSLRDSFICSILIASKKVVPHKEFCYASGMAIELGLRERKKQLVRRQIVEAARRLFFERGFDAVTVAEVARAADFSAVTVFNYFPTKEDLVFGAMEFFEERLISAVRERAAGESVLTAFRRPVLDGCRDVGSEENAERIARGGAVINASPALQMREREVVARYTQLLAELLATETKAAPDSVELWGVASALMNIHRALVIYIRGKALVGRRGPKLAAEARAQATRAFARLEGGLADYGIRTS